MSVDALYRRVTSEELDRLHNDSPFFDTFFGLAEDVDDDDYEASLEAYQEDLNRLEADGRYLNVMNEHQALNFLLTGRVEGGEPPLGSVVEGGALLGDIDVGYGPPRFLTVEEVRGVADALREVADEQVRLRFNAGAMNEAQVYPANKYTLAGSGWRETDRERLVELFHKVKGLYLDAAREGDAVLFWYQ